MFNRNRFRDVLYIWMLAAVIGECFSFLFNGMDDSIRYLTWNGIRGGLIPDLFESIWHSAHPFPYQEGAIYPPIVYVILKNFTLFLSTPFPLVNQWSEMRDLTYSLDGIKIFCVFSLIIFSCLWFEINGFFKGKVYEKIIIFIFFIASAPFIYMYERGNTVIFSMLLLLIFFQWYNSLNSYKRECALVCLAIAMCLKIYPVFAGLILFSVKDKKVFFRVAFYSLLFFFIPFYFTGGFESFFDMLNNIRSLSAETVIDMRDFGYGFKVNIENFVLMITSSFHMTSIFDYKYTSKFLLALLLIIFYNLKTEEDRILTITLMMITLPPFSWIYNVVYIFIAMLAYLNKNQYTSSDGLIIVMLYLTLVPLPYGYAITDMPGINQITLSTLMCNISIYLLIIILIIKAIYLKIIFCGDT